MRMFFSVRSQGTKEVELFSQGTLRCETLYTFDYKYVNIFSSAVLYIKLWLEEDGDLHTNHHLFSFKFIQSKAQT